MAVPSPWREAAVAAPDTSTGSTRVFLDMIRHLGRAEVHYEDSLVIDLGTSGAEKYTLGGWRSRTRGTHRFGDVTTHLVPGVTGELTLPSSTTGPTKLRIRGRAFADPRVTVYVNDLTVAHTRLPTDGSFDIVEIDVPAGTLRRGENVLQLRVEERGSDDGVRAGLALDWVVLGGANVEAPPRLGSADRLELGTGWSVTHAFEVPREAVLVGTLASGEVELLIHRDGLVPLTSMHSSGELQVPLADHAGRVIGVELRARRAASLSRLAVSVPASTTRRRPGPPVRNAIVFLVDTVRADKLSPWNPRTRVRTPGLDAWVRGATIFARGATQENWTKPSVATLLSGLLPWEHTATSGEAVVPGSVQLISEELAAAGFHTGAFICNGYVSEKFGFQQGWRTWRNYIREGRRTQASFVAADVLHWLDERPSDKPFFLYVHTIDPHVPYMPPADVLAEYDAEPYDGPVDFARDRELLEKIKIGRLVLQDRDKRRLEALYDGEITYHDTHFAAIMNALERRGLADSTLVVFTADHGEEFFDHDSVGHGHSLYEELLRVPLVMAMPGLADDGTRIDEEVGLVDVMPTVLDALGRPVPEGLSGRSVLPLLRGERPDAPSVSVAGFGEGWRSIRVGNRKLIQRTHRRWMLFDLGEDPREHHDVAEGRRLEVRYLRGLLGLALAGHDEGRHQAETTAIDSETDAQLRALGYVGTHQGMAPGEGTAP